MFLTENGFTSNDTEQRQFQCAHCGDWFDSSERCTDSVGNSVCPDCCEAATSY